MRICVFCMFIKGVKSFLDAEVIITTTDFPE